MINPESLHLRVKATCKWRNIELKFPSIKIYTIIIKLIAQALNLTDDELSRKIELSPLTLQEKVYDHRQMDLFPDYY